MRYVMLIYESPSDFEARKEPRKESYVAAWRAYFQALTAAGARAGQGAPLQDAATATTIRMRDGKRHVQDGPFPEAKDQLGGFMILELPSLDAALEWAARCPAAVNGAVEVRPVDVGYFETIIAP